MDFVKYFNSDVNAYRSASPTSILFSISENAGSFLVCPFVILIIWIYLTNMLAYPLFFYLNTTRCRYSYPRLIFLAYTRIRLWVAQTQIFFNNLDHEGSNRVSVCRMAQTKI